MTVRVTQGVRRVLATADPSPVRVTQAVRRVLSSAGGNLRVTQATRRVLVRGVPCVTTLCQLWLIQRRDGQEFAYTSHNVDVAAFGRTFRACGSMMPTAASAFAELGQSGDQSLEALITDDGVSEDEIYGGLFDDAFVEVWEFDWANPGEVPRRLIAGWIADTSFSPAKTARFSVTGPSHRLDQNAVTTTIDAACRWVFGDARCGVDRDALAVAGEVAAVIDRGTFSVSFQTGDTSQYFINGLLRWTAGANVGQECEVKEVDTGSTPVVTLWREAPILPSSGDEFELLPGCDKSRASPNGCTGYNNIINFGGFDDVPGQDAMIDTPDAKL